MSATITVSTTKPIQLIDITNDVRAFAQLQKKDGMIHIASRHTTAGIKISEKCVNLEKDFIAFCEKIAPAGADYHHNHSAVDGRANAHSHLLAMLVTASETVMVKNGELQLGTWQSIFFVELDGPRNERKVHLDFVG